MNAYLTELPSWDEFSPPLPDADGPSGDAESVDEIVDGQTYNCTTTPHSITKTPDKVVTMNPDHEILWPGSLLQGTGYSAGIGSLAELPVRERAPLTLTIDLLTGDNTEEVENPDVASVNQAIGSLIQKAHDAGHTAGSNVLYKQERMHSLAQAMLGMGVSASYVGNEIQSNLEVSFSAERTNMTAYFIQRMFTVSMVLPQTPGEVFSEAFTEDKLEQQIELGRIGPENPPVYVSNVTYGRMLMFSLSSDKTEGEIRATLNVVLQSPDGSGGGGSLTSEQKLLLENAQIQVVTIGGDASHALSLIRSGDLSEFFQEDAALTSARPISYSVRNLGDNSLAKVSETTNYNLKTCAAEALEPIGEIYEITMTRLTCLEQGGLLCGAPCQLFNRYEFFVEDVHGQTRISNWSSGVGSLLCASDYWDMDNLPAAARPQIILHYDGRESFRLHGNLQQLGVPVFKWNRTFSGRITPGNYNYRVWDETGQQCGRMQVRYNVKRVDYVYD